MAEHRDKHAVDVRLPANVTPSSLVTLWIGERLDGETAKVGRKR